MMGYLFNPSVHQTACISVFICIISIFRPLGAVELKENDACFVGATPGVCQIFKNCPILKDAQVSGTFETKDAVHCGFTITEEIICCPREWNGTAKKPVKSESRGSSQRRAVQACERIERLNNFPFLTGQILNGEVADEGEFPHAALILFSEDSVVCGGSLIDTHFVLTAAHCVISPRRRAIAVRLGVVNTKNSTVGLTIPVKDIHIHTEYKGSSKYNDIALIELAEPAFTWEKVTWVTIGPACLFTDSDTLDYKVNLTVIGWGEQNARNRSRSSTLMKVNLKLFDEKKCDAEYRSGNYETLNRGIIESQLCAYEKDKDACLGDSGGPLNLVVDRDTKRYKIVGIVSTGPSCGVDKPGLYTRVSAFLDFIEDRVWPNGVPT